MKKYNIPNYIRYKNDLLVQLKKIEDIDVQYLNQEQLQWKFMLLVENIARKFSTTQQASGVMSINDLIQEGNLNLCKAIRRIDWTRLSESEDQEKTLKSFLSKRIHEDDIYQCMLDINDMGKKITINKLAGLLNCSARTIHRNMGYELKKEKELLNQENEKI